MSLGPVMLDIEGKDWGKYTQAENREFMTGMKNAFDKVVQMR